MTKLLMLFSLPLPILYVSAGLAQEELPGLSSLALPVLVIFLLVILNGAFVASEFALIGVRPTQLEQMVKEGNGGAGYMFTVLQSPEAQKRYIATAQVGISLASLGLGMYGEPKIAQLVEPYLAQLLAMEPHDTLIVTIGYIIAVILLTYCHIVIGEMVPKSMALSGPATAALNISPFMRVMEAIFRLPVVLLNATGAAILRIGGVPPAEGHARLHSPEELGWIVTQSAEGGHINAEEEELITNIFDFAKRYVSQVMTPRRKIQAFPHDIPLQTLLKQVSESGYSRFPVYETNIDNIIGVLHLKDLVCLSPRQKENFDIRLLLRPTQVVPERYLAQHLLTAFRRRRMHLAIVLDEYGGTAGIVTLEDLIEEVVGEVRDEFDQEIEPLIEQAPGVLDVVGSYLIEDLEEYFDLGEESDLPDVETVGGLVMAKLGRLPKVGDSVTCFTDTRITVLSMDGRALARARIDFSVAKE
jgi:CBS domain containing-hemolysin-like protein